MSTTMLFVIALHLLSLLYSSSRLSEGERVIKWKESGNVWPPNWQKESDSYKAHQAELELEIMQLPGMQERWQNWMQFTQGQLVPKFTAQGFDVVATPPAVHTKLINAVKKELEDFDSIPLEDFSGTGIYVRKGPKEEVQPKFINLGKLAWEVIIDLKESHEQWAGGTPSSALSVFMHFN